MAKALSILGVVLYTALAFQLWRTQLYQSYRWLFVYSIFSVVRLSVTPLVPNGTNFYFQWWAATEVSVWMLFVLMVLELHAQIFQQYPGLASYGRRLFQVGLAVSIPISLLTLFPEFGPDEFRLISVTSVVIIQRGLLTSLILFLFVLLLSLVWLRVSLSRNCILHTIVFFLYFSAKVGMAFVFQALGIQMADKFNLALALVSDLCVLAWIVGLTPAGEAADMKVGHQWNPEQGERLVQQLSAINSTLSRSSRK